MVQQRGTQNTAAVEEESELVLEGLRAAVRRDSRVVETTVGDLKVRLPKMVSDH